MNRGITQKQYLGLVPPTEEDARSSQMLPFHARETVML